jgi:hypothetical protein
MTMGTINRRKGTSQYVFIFSSHTFEKDHELIESIKSIKIKFVRFLEIFVKCSLNFCEILALGAQFGVIKI